MKKMKKITAGLLAICMMAGYGPLVASAEESHEIETSTFVVIKKTDDCIHVIKADDYCWGSEVAWDTYILGHCHQADPMIQDLIANCQYGDIIAYSGYGLGYEKKYGISCIYREYNEESDNSDNWTPKYDNDYFEVTGSVFETPLDRVTAKTINGEELITVENFYGRQFIIGKDPALSASSENIYYSPEQYQDMYYIPVKTLGFLDGISFEEFLEMSDEEFLALPNLTESLKKEYYGMLEETPMDRAVIRFDFTDECDFDPERISTEPEEAKKDFCELLNISEESAAAIYALSYHRPVSPDRELYPGEFLANTIDVYPASPKENPELYKEHYYNEFWGKFAFYVRYQTCVNADTFTLDYPVGAPRTGDANEDGEVNATDAAIILEAIAAIGSGSKNTLNSVCEQCADVNTDHVIDAVDAAIVLTYSAEVGSGDYAGTLYEYVNRLIPTVEPPMI